METKQKHTNKQGLQACALLCVHVEQAKSQHVRTENVQSEWGQASGQAGGVAQDFAIY